MALLSVYPSNRLAAQCPDGSPPPCRAAPTDPGRKPGVSPNSVAVLYFDNLSRDTADAYLADGLAEELTVQLGRIERLAISPRSAVRRYRGTALGPLELGRALGVAHLVSGSVRRSQNRLRVTVELVRSASAARVWGEQYDRTDADLLDIQESIARAVVASIAGRLLPAEQASLASRPTQRPAAYDRFLRGNFYLAQRLPESVLRAIVEYEAASRVDPTFADASARIGLAYALFLDWGWPHPQLPRDSLVLRGREAAEHAIALDSNSAEAWLARGYTRSHDDPRGLRGVTASLERAVALDPRNAEALHQYGYVLYTLGRDDDALVAFRRALAIDPARAITLEHISRVHRTNARYAESRLWIDSAVAVDPTNPNFRLMRAITRLRQGDTTGAIGDMGELERTSPPELALAGRAQLAAAARDTATARQLIAQYVTTPPVRNGLNPWLAVQWATVHVMLERFDEALELLEGATPRGAVLWNTLRSPQLAPLRAMPRFQRLVEESRPPEAP